MICEQDPTLVTRKCALVENAFERSLRLHGKGTEKALERRWKGELVRALYRKSNFARPKEERESVSERRTARILQQQYREGMATATMSFSDNNLWS